MLIKHLDPFDPTSVLLANGHHLSDMKSSFKKPSQLMSHLFLNALYMSLTNHKLNCENIYIFYRYINVISKGCTLYSDQKKCHLWSWTHSLVRFAWKGALLLLYRHIVRNIFWGFLFRYKSRQSIHHMFLVSEDLPLAIEAQGLAMNDEGAD